MSRDATLNISFQGDRLSVNTNRYSKLSKVASRGELQPTANEDTPRHEQGTTECWIQGDFGIIAHRSNLRLKNQKRHFVYQVYSSLLNDLLNTKIMFVLDIVPFTGFQNNRATK